MTEFDDINCYRNFHYRFKQRPEEGCKKNNTHLIDGKCYEKCDQGYIGSETSNFCWKSCNDLEPINGKYHKVDCGAFCATSYTDCDALKFKSDDLDVDFIERIYNRDAGRGRATMQQTIIEIQEFYPELLKDQCYISNVSTDDSTNAFDDFDDFEPITRPVGPEIDPNTKPNIGPAPIIIDDDDDDGWGFLTL